MQDVDQFVQRINDSKKDISFDLSNDEDLSIAIMNLISIEEHFFFTAKKSKDDKYFDLLAETRKIRQDLMKKLIPSYEGEVWCISKHLLASSMRLMEVGTKEFSHGDEKTAKEMFEKAYNLYSLFWGLNLGALNLGDIKKINQNQIDKEDNDSRSIFKKLGQIVKKAIDCCIE